MEQEKKWMLLERIGKCPFNAQNGITGVDVLDGKAVVSAEIAAQSKNIWGLPHGGLIYTAGDVAAGLSVQTLYDGRAVTISGTIDYLTAAKDAEKLIATGIVTKMGKSVAFVRTEIADENGKLIAMGSFTFHLCRD